VNNFDCVLLVRNGEIASVERVTARGREEPLLGTREMIASLARQVAAPER
jgi:hypothetical protein